jgi:CubicO group peptidase (beta-lactamase class C family)
MIFCAAHRGIAMNFKRIATALAFLGLWTPAATRAQSTDNSTHQKIDAIFSDVTSPDAPGLAVLVQQNGKTVFARGYGVRDLRTKMKIDAHTNFRLASFTKQFTAMAIMLLVHDGKLHYDDKLTKFFPDFPAYAKDVTIRNLLNHTSGLPDYEDLMDAEEKIKGPLWTPEHQIQDEEVLSLLEKAAKGFFAPGTGWAYSNSGYVVLGLIVAKVSGKPFGDFLAERIFKPLHMDHTLMFVKGKNEVTNRAYGHTKEKETGAFKETDQSPTSATQGDGGIYTGLEELAKWDDALRNHTLLSAEEMKPAITEAKLADGSSTHWPAEPHGDNGTPGKPVAYGFGWFVDPYEGHPRMWHTGGTMGFATIIERFLNENLTIIILCNRTDLDPQKLSLQVADLFLSGKN